MGKTNCIVERAKSGAKRLGDTIIDHVKWQADCIRRVSFDDLGVGVMVYSTGLPAHLSRPIYESMSLILTASPVLIRKHPIKTLKLVAGF